MPVRSLTLGDGGVVEFPEGGGGLTRQAMAYYKDYVKQYLRDHVNLSLSLTDTG